LISLIECKDGNFTTDIICACLVFSVLRAAVCEPVSMATDPNVVIVDTKSKMLLSMLHLILSCFSLPSSDKDSTIFLEQRIMGDLIDVEENVKLQIEQLLTDLSKRSDTISEIQGTLLALMDDVFAILVSSGIAIRSTHFL
jgi:hypothetical protein